MNEFAPNPGPSPDPGGPRFYQIELVNKLLANRHGGVMELEAILDPAGQLINVRYLQVSQKLADDSGMAPEQMEGQLMLDLFPGVRDSPFWQVYQQVLNTGQAHQWEDHYQGEGYDSYLDTRVDKLGKNRLLVSYMNIDALKKAQHQAEQTGQRLQSVVDGSPNGILACEPVYDQYGQVIDLRVMMANQAATRPNGPTVDQLLGQTLLTLYPQLAGTPTMTSYLHTSRTGEVQRLEVHYQNDELDNWYDVVVTPLPNQGCLISFLDVNQRKQNEAELRRQTDQLRTTLDASLNSIISMTALRDKQGEIVDFRMDTANAPVKWMTGRTVAEILGRTLLDIFPGNVQNGFMDLYKRVVNTGHPEQAMQYYQDDRGLEGWFEVSAVKQEGDRVVITFINVTDRQRAQQTADFRLRQLQESNENLSQFAFVASHDLQAPLRKIQQFGTMLLEQHGSELTKSGVDLLKRINSAAGRMSDLVRGLLDYSRLDTSRSMPELVALNPLLEGILSDLEVVIAEKQATIEVDEWPQVWGDPFQLQQLFSNLLTNALKFSKPGEKPHVRLRCRVVAGSAIKNELLTTKVNANDLMYYELSVIDQGIGFDEMYAERIFRMFERLPGKTAYPGSGIGLAVCKRVVENHEGLMRVESRPGEGSAFRVYLPIVTRFELA